MWALVINEESNEANVTKTGLEWKVDSTSWLQVHCWQKQRKAASLSEKQNKKGEKKNMEPQVAGSSACVCSPAQVLFSMTAVSKLEF